MEACDPAHPFAFIQGAFQAMAGHAAPTELRGVRARCVPRRLSQMFFVPLPIIPPERRIFLAFDGPKGRSASPKRCKPSRSFGLAMYTAVYNRVGWAKVDVGATC